MSTGVVEEAYKKIYHMYTSRKVERVNLDRLILSPTNASVDKRKKQGMSSLPGQPETLYSTTSVQQYSS